MSYSLQSSGTISRFAEFSKTNLLQLDQKEIETKRCIITESTCWLKVKLQRGLYSKCPVFNMRECVESHMYKIVICLTSSCNGCNPHPHKLAFGVESGSNTNVKIVSSLIIFSIRWCDGRNPSHTLTRSHGTEEYINK